MKDFLTRLSGKEYLLAVQHLFAMFGATVLVPLLTGLSPSVALVTAGIGTLIFHLVTKGKVPVFLGSSFAFIAGIGAAVENYGIPYAQGGVLIAGVIYLLFAVAAYFVGVDKIKKLFPPVVTGPVIVVIGLSLAGVALDDAKGVNTGVAGFTDAGIPIYNNFHIPMSISLSIALFVVIIVVLCNATKFKGIFKLIPILIGIGSGYVLCLILNAFNVIDMNFSPFKDNAWINIPYVTDNFFSLPKFKLTVILAIAPVALVTFMEHIGDITTNGAVVGKDFFKDPGLHRTLLGDGLATMVAGFFGGPSNTTYSENTGVLAATKNYNPKILRWTAVFAIILGLLGKFGAILQTIPDPVKGGIELVLFGMIAAIGMRTIAESKTDMTNFRNIIVVSLILVLGIGISVSGNIDIVFSENFTLSLSGLFVATVVGVVVNLILPKVPDKDEREKAEIKDEV